MSQENVEIVARSFEAFQEGMRRGDLAVWFDSEDLADDFEWVIPPEVVGLGTYRGREGFLEFMRAWTEDYENWSIDLERVIDAGEDRVVGVFHHRAIGKASGVPIELVQGIVWELADGRVVRMRNYMTPAEALEAAGLSE
jgi:ketosteroid isomerase-like protein